MKIKIKELEKVIRKVLSTRFKANEIDLMLPVIMFGELSDTKSHGIFRIKSILAKVPKSAPKLIQKVKVSKIIEGNDNPGMLVGAIACNEVVNIAKENGIGIVGTHGSVSSSGCLTYYAEKIAKEGLIGIILARAPADIAPFGGLERLFGTNPIAFGIPSDGDPLVFDMATSAISYGAVARAMQLGKELPNNVAINQKGDITRDPQESLEGAFLPFDNSYKGYGLAMMVEILAGVLPGADFLDLGEGDEWGNLFIVIDPNILSETSSFKMKVRKFIERVRNSKSIDGNKIRIPGEGRINKRNEALKNGYVDVDEKLYQGILK